MEQELKCIFGVCAARHEGECLYVADERESDRYKRVWRLICREDVKRNSQDDFNAAHEEAVYYGDEGDYLVIGAQYPELQALELLKKRLYKDTGESTGYDFDGIYAIGMTVGINEDGEMDFAVAGPTDKVYWTAWGVRQN